ncbi:Aste57867_23821 [Aphanomyces stellatus]|uniref:Aste57867_23821 protein n=1 Tax=Aphanomyces stellatus TaxID=120398 RepID=A0A485LPI1_9STRA|nr:hypothetical protein As57867_023748 [Aphanomyces stellatus]VFU00465.1 Aste57867_23821 [Aphanomyces stellatus]
MISFTKLALLATAALAVVNANGDDVDKNSESICGSDQSKGAVCYKDTTYAAQYKVAQATARLWLSGGYCTGWLFGSEGHLITNWHCIGSDADAKALRSEFGSECNACDHPDINKKLGCPGVFVSNSSTLILADEKLDFALVKLNLNPGFDLTKYGYLQARASLPALNETIFIAQHPGAKAKKLSVVTDDGSAGRIVSLKEDGCTGGTDSVGHNVDTEPGSSGSPVIAFKDNAVVALHDCGGCTASGGRNTATKLSNIVEVLKAKNLLPKDSIIKDKC